MFVTLKVPSPFENATGIVPQPAGPVSAMSTQMSPLKSPVTALAPTVAAQVGKFVTALLVTWKLPLPFEKAIGMPLQPDTPVSAMSSRPSPSKSPTTACAAAPTASPGKLVTVRLVTVKVPSPFENAIGIDVHPDGPGDRDVVAPVAVEVAAHHLRARRRRPAGERRERAVGDGERAVAVRERNRDGRPCGRSGERDVPPAVAVEVARDGLDARGGGQAPEQAADAPVGDRERAVAGRDRNRHRGPVGAAGQRDIGAAVGVEVARHNLDPGRLRPVGKLATALLVTLKPPEPFDRATGIEPQPTPPVSMRSAVPSRL